MQAVRMDAAEDMQRVPVLGGGRNGEESEEQQRKRQGWTHGRTSFGGARSAR
jgi:hypothetical protein